MIESNTKSGALLRHDGNHVKTKIPPVNLVAADVSPLHLSPSISQSQLTSAATVRGFKARLLAALGVEVLRLVRIAIGPLALGDLAKGSFRRLTAAEVESLRMR